MAYYAYINEDNVVVDVIRGKDETELIDGLDTEAYYAQGTPYTVKRTSYNTVAGIHNNGGTPYRFNYAGIGYKFVPSKGTDGAFVPPKPYASWNLNGETCLWEAPTPMPVDDKFYRWDEDTTSWVEIEAL